MDLKLCTHINQPLTYNILYGFLTILVLRGQLKNMLKFWNFFEVLFFEVLNILKMLTIIVL